MAKIDCKINLVVFLDVDQTLFVFHVDCYKLIADFWSMLSVVHKAELLSFYVCFHLRMSIQSDTFTLNFFTPSIFIEAFSEKNDISQNNSVIVLVNSIAHSEKIKSKNFIY